MKKINLGKTDLQIAPIIFGANVLGWTLKEKEAFEILDAFVDRGFNAIDTANNYPYWIKGNTGGESEEILGKWMKNSGNRDKIIIATKVGGRNLNQNKPNNKKEHIISEVEKSLKRLQTDYIDLYQTHYDDEKTTVEEMLSAYDLLIKEGKVRFIGASNISPERLEESLIKSERFNLPRYATLQPEYNLYDCKYYETHYKKIVEQNELAVIPYYSLASGFLTGKYRNSKDLSISQRGEGVKQYMNEKGFNILSALDEVAEEQKTSLASIALAWLLSRPNVVAPIASATKPHHLDAMVDATKIVLSQEDKDMLREANRCQ